MVDSLITCFPNEFQPSRSQVSTIKEIEKGFESHKFVICCAPTGSGKSFISKTLGNAGKQHDEDFKNLINSYEVFKRNSVGDFLFKEEISRLEAGGTYVLTVTKALQDQYQQLFKDTEILKGKNNYQCTYDENFSVSYAPCLVSTKIKEKCWRSNSCPYYSLRNKISVSRFAALNYDMFFSLPEVVKKRQYIICDEASELEDQIVKAFTCHINFDIFRKIKLSIPPVPSSTNYQQIGTWLNTVVYKIEEYIDLFKKRANKKRDDLYHIDTQNFSLISGTKSKIKELLNTWYDSEYIIQRNSTSITFIPVKVNNLSKNIFNHGEKILLMSATIIDPQNFAKNLGIDNFKYIEVESTFDPEKAPIFVSTKNKLNYNNLQRTLPKIAKQISEICNFHKEEKGIIHTHTSQITEYLKKAIKDDRIIFREPGVKNEDIIFKHFNSVKPTIIASPSLTHGIDLKGDFSRFQIIIKAPYLPINDERVKRMMKNDKNWYINKMLSILIQACGRGVRSKEDTCITYILDGTIPDIIFEHKNKLPKYFLKRFM